jgi:hypothetical protein
MLAHGFTIEILELDCLATRAQGTVYAGGRPILSRFANRTASAGQQ